MPEQTTDRPTQPGWYWVRGPGLSDDGQPPGWQVVHILRIPGDILVAMGTARGYIGALTYPAIADAEWIGPITPDDVLDRRRLDFLGRTYFDMSRTPVLITPWLIQWRSGGNDNRISGTTLRTTIDMVMAMDDRNEEIRPDVQPD